MSDIIEDVARTKRMDPWNKNAGIRVSKREYEQMRGDLDWWADVADSFGAVVTGWTFRHEASLLFPNGRVYSFPGWLVEIIAKERNAAIAAARPHIERETREADKQALITVRAVNAANFAPDRLNFEAYDRAVLDCCKAIEAAAIRNLEPKA